MAVLDAGDGDEEPVGGEVVVAVGIRGDAGEGAEVCGVDGEAVEEPRGFAV